jgi:hypothetical protein
VRLFGFEVRRAKATAARGGPAQARGRPSWFWPGTQVAGGGRSRWSPTIPLEKELEVYDEMRRLFPVLDSAISKLVRLCGRVEIEGGGQVRAELASWLGAVPVNQAQRGFPSWLETHLDQMLMYGKAVGEIVPNMARNEVYALTNLHTRTIELAPGTTPLQLRILQRQAQAPFLVELDPAWTLYSVHRPRGDDPHGSSLLRALPFVAEATSIIENATAQVWKRMGAPPYHVNWEPEEGFSDPDGTLAAGFVDAIAAQFQDAMAARDQGQIKDFFSSGKVSVSVIGSDAQLLALQEPFRAFSEQMVAATGLPAWMLGFHWSSTERLSAQQADLIVSHVEALRREVQPQIEHLCDLRQRLAGRSGRFRVTWSRVSLRDLVETARGELLAEQARHRRIENGRRMWELGYWTQEQAARNADPAVTTPARTRESPPAREAGHGMLDAGDRAER